MEESWDKPEVPLQDQKEIWNLIHGVSSSTEKARKDGEGEEGGEERVGGRLNEGGLSESEKTQVYDFISAVKDETVAPNDDSRCGMPIEDKLAKELAEFLDIVAADKLDGEGRVMRKGGGIKQEGWRSLARFRFWPSIMATVKAKHVPPQCLYDLTYMAKIFCEVMVQLFMIYNRDLGKYPEPRDLGWLPMQPSESDSALQRVADTVAVAAKRLRA
eukprot:9254119-Prorocentrum_lima.AAC.1